MTQKFKLRETTLAGAYLIDSFCADDERGSLIKDYNIDIFQNWGINHELKEVFYTVSQKGVIRAIHFQEIRQQPKLVRCISGSIYDVIVDLRKESPTFGHWQSFELTGKNMKSILVPAHFGHGYLVLEDSIVSYKCSEVFYAEGDSGIRWDDEKLAISWPVERVGGKDKLIVSEKDKSLVSFEEFCKSTVEKL